MPAFDRDAANTRLVTTTDATGTLLDGGVREYVWNGAAWVRAAQGVQSTDIITAIVTGTVTTIGGSTAATTNIGGGFATVNVSNATLTAIVSGTVTSIGGSAAATVNVAGGFATVNVGNTTITITGTVNSIGGSAAATVNVNDGRITATVNLGSIGTVNVGNSLTIGTVPTVNVGNTVNVLGTATVNLGSIGTMNVGNTVNVSLLTSPLSVQQNGASTWTVNVAGGFATVNLGSIGTINIGNSHAVTVTGNVTATVNLGSIGTVNVGNTTTITSASANPSLGQGKTLQFGTIAQTVATTSQLVAGTSGNKVKVVSYVFTIGATGNVKFQSSADLTGAFNLSPLSGISSIGQPSSHLFETVASGALILYATGGAVNGHFSYIVEA